MRGLRIATLTIAVLVAGAPAARAQDEPLTPAGVHMKRAGNRVRVTFDARAAKLYRRLRGRKVTLRCVVLGPPDTLVSETRGDSLSLVAPRERRPLRFRLPSRRFDFCVLTRADGAIPPIFAAFTPRGTTDVDERQATGRMLGVVAFAGLLAPNATAWPLPDRVVAAAHGQAVALAAPGDSPPSGKVGYYSDGAHHATFAVLSRAGRRLFIDSNGDVTSTNVLLYLTEDD